MFCGVCVLEVVLLDNNEGDRYDSRYLFAVSVDRLFHPGGLSGTVSMEQRKDNILCTNDR